jgi:phage terminase large subunit-like protein
MSYLDNLKNSIKQARIQALKELEQLGITPKTRIKVDLLEYHKNKLQKLIDALPPKHKEVFDSYINNDRTVVCAGRRWGKTHITTLACIWFLLYKKGNCGWTAERQDLFIEVYENIYLFFNDTHKLCYVKSRRKNKLIELNNGNRLKFFIGKSISAFRGEAMQFAVVDEASYLTSARLNDLINTQIVPTFATTQGKLAVISTPNDKNCSYFAELTNNPKYKVYFAKTSEAPWVNKEWLEEQKETTTDLQYAQEYEAKINLTWDVPIFDKENLQYYESLPRLVAKIITVDTASKTGKHNDYTAFACMGIDDKKNYYLIDYKILKEESMKLTKSLGEFYLKHKGGLDTLYIEEKDIGTAVIQQMRAILGIHARPIIFGNENNKVEKTNRRISRNDFYVNGGKRERAGGVAYLVEDNRVFINKHVNHKELFTQMKDFRHLEDKNNKTHDDLIDVFVYGLMILHKKHDIRPNSVNAHGFLTLQNYISRLEDYV